MRSSKNIRKELKVSIILSRDSGKTWNLTISDELSGLVIGEVHIDSENFSDFMSHTYTKGTMEYYANPNIGKKMEVKTVTVSLALLAPIFEGYDDRDSDMGRIFHMAEEMNPGYVADKESFNGYRLNHLDKTYKVTLRRYVDV